MCSFDEQPLLKDNPYKKVKKLGVMSILDKKGHHIKTFLKPLDIFLLVGKQLNDKDKKGFGLNHIFYKHFNSIHKRFYCKNGDQIDYVQTIVNFLLFFLHDSNKLEIVVSCERDRRPICVRSPYGRLVLEEHYWQKNGEVEHFYKVITFVPNTSAVGVFIGFYKSDVEFLM